VTLRRPTPAVPPPDVPPIGSRLRAARRARGLTLDAVAEATDLTKGFLSRLERDEVSPSVASLVAVCHAVGLAVGDLFEPVATAHVPAGRGVAINFGGTRVVETLLTPGWQRHLQVIHSDIAPGGHGGEQLYTLSSEVEFVHVIRGDLVVRFPDDEIRLATGDALTFAGREPHTWRNASSEDPCEVVWVLAPAP
jgi:transcriptional regulator with XRE-family HTH domain